MQQHLFVNLYFVHVKYKILFLTNQIADIFWIADKHTIFKWSVNKKYMKSRLNFWSVLQWSWLSFSTFFTVTNNTLREENETLQMKIARLENECKLLRQENQLLSKAQPSSRPSCSPSPQRHRFESNTSTHGDDENTTSTSNSITPEELQEQLKLAEESLEKLTTERTDTIERFTQRQQQLMNFITTILLFMVIFFVMILLGLIDVSPGALPLLDEHSWNEFLEHLF